MEVTFFKTQKQLAKAINTMIDDYWNGNVTEEQMICYINRVFVNNGTKMYINSEFPAGLKQRCGKKRLELIEKIMRNKRGAYHEKSV